MTNKCYFSKNNISMKKLFVCLVIFLIPTLNYGFKKLVLPYSIVISKSELIVEGSISKVLNGRYEFTISQYIKGSSTPKIIVKVFEDWICDRRIKSPEVGQKLILFLEKKNNAYCIINDSTGELFVAEDNCVSTFMEDRFPKAEVLKKGISMFLETYTLHGDLNNRFSQNTYFQCNKSIFEIYLMKKDNDFFRFLIDKELEYYTVKATLITPLRFQFVN